MAAASDKARFYLEQYVPELQEYARLQIFTRDQISAITAKRSDFEHTLNARGSRPQDYLQYVEYEMNLDRLRKKRCQRMGVKTTTFSGQRTVFFIFDRATKKFPGAIELWTRYIEFCKREGANKKLAKVFTAVLRLHPRMWNLWVLAAKYYAETQGDMATARSYMQRGLRFCRDEKSLYLEYMKLEMVYLAKLAARRKILGLDETRQEKEDEGEDMIALPTVTAEDLDPEARKGVEEVNTEVLQRLAAAPAFAGAIPIAIFDAAMSQLKPSAKEPGPVVAEEFFDLASLFDGVPAARTVLQHILDRLAAESPDSVPATMCQAKFHLFAVPVESEEFPVALAKTLAVLRQGTTNVSEGRHDDLAKSTALMFLPYLRTPDKIDEDVQVVIESTIVKHMRMLSPSRAASNPGLAKSGDTALMIEWLNAKGRFTDGTNLERIIANSGLG